jgi:hypothetical protein
MRVDISPTPEAELLALRAAHAAHDEIENLIDVLKSRSKDIHKDIMMMSLKIAEDRGVEIPFAETIGIQIDWVDKTLDILTENALETQLKKEGKVKVPDTWTIKNKEKGNG